VSSTEPSSTPRPPDAAASTTPSGVDLARAALQAAKANARRRGEQPGAGKPRRVVVRTGRSVRGDGREPRGLAAVLQQLVTERAWEVPAAGGTVLQQWPDIAPGLAPHVRAVAFDAEHGRLDLLPDSPAYATELRVSTARLTRTRQPGRRPRSGPQHPRPAARHPHLHPGRRRARLAFRRVRYREQAD
jgi:predicted nucleic acid-binding Zn ribbon protein